MAMAGPSIQERHSISLDNWAGQFVHRDTDVYFDYVGNPEYLTGLGPMGEAFIRTNCDVRCFPHRICVNDPHGWKYRFARVLKTVAHVVIDEDEHGHPVIERWKIKRHRQYSKGG